MYSRGCSSSVIFLYFFYWLAWQIKMLLSTFGTMCSVHMIMGLLCVVPLCSGSLLHAWLWLRISQREKDQQHIQTRNTGNSVVIVYFFVSSIPCINLWCFKKIVGAAPSDTNDSMEKGQETRLTRSPVGLRSTFKSERRSY